MNREIRKTEKSSNKKEYLLLLLSAGITAVLCGGVGALFSYTLKFANSLFASFMWLVFVLPLGGIFTVFIYKAFKLDGKGINTVFSAVKANKNIPFLLAPAVFVGTAITQLLGGSAGKEGAALQIGGAIASPFAKCFKIKDENYKILLLCGMTSLFSAVFTTPLTALAFGLEIIYISRKFYFKAVLPLFTSSFLSYTVARLFGVHPERFSIGTVPKFGADAFFKIVLVIVSCSAASVVFCFALEGSKMLFKKLFKNEYIRICVGGVLIIILTLIFKSGNYNGGGMHIIEQVLKTGSTVYWAFALKILFTAITNAAGFKGGEIVPALFIGATLGAAVGALIGLPPIFAAALGMAVLFSGATKCVAAALMLSIELFGFCGVGYFVISVILARVLTSKIGIFNKN